MEKRLFCFDVDGTLRDTIDHQVPASTIEALKRLKLAGHKIIVSTGRAWDSLQKTQIVGCAPWDGYVLNNGQTLINDQGEVIESYVFDPQTVIETIKVADSLDMPVILKKDKRLITREPNEYVYEVQRYFKNVIPETGRYNGKDNVYAMVLYGPIGYDYAPYLHIKGLDVLPGMSYFADATISGVTKGTACLAFAKRFGLSGYTCFGDSQNDLEMFKHADFAICMGDGDELAKAAADYITDDLFHDGILNACIHLGYIEEEV
ncbi:MAG: HAD-IIB family hydrolase [Erysipelotrichaceae bacterium]|nr:HAD-IIB family hydrolase [Erysipelotrichaceae bacterium]